MQPIRCDSTIKNVALDTLFLIVLQAAVVIALGKFIHLGLRRHNLPSATSQILVRGTRMAAGNADAPALELTKFAFGFNRICRQGSSWGAWACTT